MDKIKSSYKLTKNIYDDVLTQKKWWSRLYIKLFWQGVDDNKIAEKILSYIPNTFDGTLLDVPVGTAVFTVERYKQLKAANITCLDYSLDMLSRAELRFEENKLGNINLIQGDVGALPFADNSLDIVLSMNGMHVFPDKDKAYSEIYRVLKARGSFVACYYIKGESKVTDFLVNKILSKKGWFTPPFETYGEVKKRLLHHYDIEEFKKEGSMLYFKAKKK